MPSTEKDKSYKRPSPSELRSMLGDNLRQLSEQAVSISALCRDLGINRTQFNRYLAGESFPRPDVLHRICTYFGVDARILLEPVANIVSVQEGILRHPAVAQYLGNTARPVTQDELPSGFYRFSRRSFMDDESYVQGLIYVFREDDGTFVKGFEARDAMLQQGLPTSLGTREFRGVVLPQDDGIAILASRRNATTASFNYLSHVPTFENNYWVGYVTRPVRENVAGRRIERLVYEFLGTTLTKALPVARLSGFCKAEDLLPFHQNLLKVGKEFG